MAAGRDRGCRRVPVRRHGRPPVPAVEPGIFWLTRAGRPGELFRPDFSRDTISQIPPNTATAPIPSVGWELSIGLLTWSCSRAPLRNRTVDLLLIMQAGFVL